MEGPGSRWEFTVDDAFELYGKENIFDGKAILDNQIALLDVPFLCGPISTISGTALLPSKLTKTL